MGEEGRKRALREFDERAVFAAVLAEYARLLEGKGLGARIPDAWREEAFGAQPRRAAAR